MEIYSLTKSIFLPDDGKLSASQKFYIYYTLLERRKLVIPCRYVRHMSLVVVISSSLSRPSMPDVVVTYTKSEDLYSRNYEMVNS